MTVAAALEAAFAEDDHLRATLSPEEYEAAMDEADAAAWDELPTLELWFWLKQVCPNYSREDLDQAVRAAHEEASPGERDLIAVVRRIARRQVAREARKAARSRLPSVEPPLPEPPATRPRSRRPRRVRRARSDEDATASPAQPLVVVELPTPSEEAFEQFTDWLAEYLIEEAWKAVTEADAAGDSTALPIEIPPEVEKRPRRARRKPKLKSH